MHLSTSLYPEPPTDVRSLADIFGFFEKKCGPAVDRGVLDRFCQCVFDDASDRFCSRSPRSYLYPSPERLEREHFLFRIVGGNEFRDVHT
mmetsp:Transcript_7123/g.13975  ORF Transcript_7123/g.13975 Transcript_7123/m.13975 type:complete len:90 (-) Transcript_7123:876-1145(-)